MSLTRILVADDEESMRWILSKALKKKGFAVDLAKDGEEALLLMRANSYDLAILDIKMPRMDGMEMLRRLRQKTDMPVIFLTSKDEEIDELFGLKMGADEASAAFARALPVVATGKAATAAPGRPDGSSAEAALTSMSSERSSTWFQSPRIPAATACSPC